MNFQIFVEAAAGSCEKRCFNEQTLEWSGVRRTTLPYPFPYGFILHTQTGDGEGIDAYVITKDELKPGQNVTCETLGMLEVFEGAEADHKVLACLPGQAVEMNAALLETLRDFIRGIWQANPEVTIRFGKALQRLETEAFIQSHAVKSIL